MTRAATLIMPRRTAALLGGLVVLILAGCSNDPNLMRFRNNTDQPNEFSVVPARPLQTPTDIAALPAPTPGRPNRAEPSPVDDALLALGGSASAINRAGIPSSDSAVVSYASRFGTDPAIRDQLAEEDLAFRQRRLVRPLESLANVNVYYRAYEGQNLDQQAEISRLRARGVRVPSAPPAELQPR